MTKDKEKNESAALNREEVIRGLVKTREILINSAEGWREAAKESAEGYKMIGQRIGRFFEKNIFMGFD